MQIQLLQALCVYISIGITLLSCVLQRCDACSMDHSIDEHTPGFKTLAVQIKKHYFNAPSSSPWRQCRQVIEPERKLKQTRNLFYDSADKFACSWSMCYNINFQSQSKHIQKGGWWHLHVRDMVSKTVIFDSNFAIYAASNIHVSAPTNQVHPPLIYSSWPIASPHLPLTNSRSRCKVAARLCIHNIQ